MRSSRCQVRALAARFTPRAIASIAESSIHVPLSWLRTWKPRGPANLCMIQLKDAGTKGLGLFATQTIAIGTRILTEKPLFTVTSARDVYGVVRRLSQQDRAAFWSLSSGHGNKHTWFTRAEAAGMTVYETFRYLFWGRKDHATSDSPKTRPTIAKYLLARSIFLSNNFALSTQPVLRALFPQISRLNHNCIPNAQGNWNSNLQPASFTIHAVREVAKDEELTLSYLTDPSALRNERQASLQGFGFDCLCAICKIDSHPAITSESRRNQLRASIEDFARSNAEVGEAEKRAPKKTEMEVMSVMLATYEEEGVRGRELATLYLAAARLAKQEGDLNEAKRLAERGLELDRSSVGADSPLFKESLDIVREMDLGKLALEAEKLA